MQQKSRGGKAGRSNCFSPFLLLFLCNMPNHYLTERQLRKSFAKTLRLCAQTPFFTQKAGFLRYVNKL